MASDGLCFQIRSPQEQGHGVSYKKTQFKPPTARSVPSHKWMHFQPFPENTDSSSKRALVASADPSGNGLKRLTFAEGPVPGKLTTDLTEHPKENGLCAFKSSQTKLGRIFKRWEEMKVRAHD